MRLFSPLASLQSLLSKTSYWHLKNPVCRILALFSMNEEKTRMWAIYRQRRSTTSRDRYLVSAETHTSCTQPHYCPIRPSHVHTSPSPVVSCIPLDDITGNKTQQQDNKRSETQSTSFITDFITPQLMDVDLYTLLHLICSNINPPAPPHPPPPLRLLALLSHSLFQSLQFVAFFPLALFMIQHTVLNKHKKYSKERVGGRGHV